MNDNFRFTINASHTNTPSTPLKPTHAIISLCCRFGLTNCVIHILQCSLIDKIKINYSLVLFLHSTIYDTFSISHNPAAFTNKNHSYMFQTSMMEISDTCVSMHILGYFYISEDICVSKNTASKYPLSCSCFMAQCLHRIYRS